MKIPDDIQVASIDVDAQMGFTPICPDELPIQEGDEIVDELNANAKFANYRIGTKDAHPANPIWLSNDHHPPMSILKAKHVDRYWPRHCVPGSKGFDLLVGLPHPSDYDFFVWKGIEPDMHPYGACYHDLTSKLSTGLIEFLHEHHVTWVIVGGLATDYCVKHTVLQLLEAGFKVVVNKAACRGVEAQASNETFELLTSLGAILVENAQAITR